MHTDRYGNEISVSSAAARDAYVAAVDTSLAAGPDAVAAYESVIEEDPDFALGHLGLARTHQMWGRRAPMLAALDCARACIATATDREASHLNALGLLVDGKGAAGRAAVHAHLREYPRDVLVAQPLMGVFGLVGFSGEPGREAEQLAVVESLAPHYGDDWWFLSVQAFAEVETGRIARAEALIERAAEQAPHSANISHIKSHVIYEAGDTEAGLAYLTDWMAGYGRSGLMHCHNSWHVALWSLAAGDIDGMWRVIDQDLRPGVSESPPINIATDVPAIYFRAALAGIEISAERWAEIADYASKAFPNSGMQFVDIHAAIAHAMAGNGEALDRLVRDAKGPAADFVRHGAAAFGAFAKGDWAEALAELTVVMSDHARLGGSRAQRDIVEYATAMALLRLGRADEAARLLAMRRPLTDRARAVAGLPIAA